MNMVILSGLPNWVIELIIAGIGSILGAIIYAWILFKCEELSEICRRF